MNHLDRKFIGQTFQDGDFEYSPPKWRETVDDLMLDHEPIDHADEHAGDHFIKEDEIAIKHPITGAIIRLSNEGYIDIFAGNQLGIRLDPQTNSINLFGDKINFFGGSIQIRSKPNGLIWNGYAMNPELYYENSEEKEPLLTGTKKKWVFTQEKGWHWEEKEWAVRPFIQSTETTQYSEGMLQILRDLGLPVEENK